MPDPSGALSFFLSNAWQRRGNLCLDFATLAVVARSCTIAGMSTGSALPPPPSAISSGPVYEAWKVVRSMRSPREPVSARELERRLEEVDSLLTRAVGGPTDPTVP